MGTESFKSEYILAIVFSIFGAFIIAAIIFIVYRRSKRPKFTEEQKVVGVAGSENNGANAVEA